METCAQESNLFFKILPSAIKQIMNFTESIRWPKRVALNKELACLYLLFRKGSKGNHLKKAIAMCIATISSSKFNSYSIEYKMRKRAVYSLNKKVCKDV